MSAGVGFGIFAMLVIFGMGSMMVGNLTPFSRNNAHQPVQVIGPMLEPTKPNLQLQTFPGVTFTPTPSPTLPPQPNETGGFNYGEGPGGNSAPGGGGGQSAGSAI